MSNITVTKFEDINKLKPREIFDMVQVENIFKKSYGEKDFASTLEREKVFALQLIANNPDLAKCEPFSIYTSIINLSVCKITLNPAMNQAALVPYNVNTGTKDNPIWTKKAQLNIMYQGKIDILTGAGAMKYVKACELVYDCDKFEMDMGVVKKHIPDFTKQGELIGGYIIAIMPDGKEKHLFMKEDQFLKRKEKAKSKTFWDAWGDEMRKKTLVNQLYKTLPKTTSYPAIAKAFQELEEENTVEVEHQVVEQEGVVVEEDTNFRAVEFNEVENNSNTEVVPEEKPKEKPKKKSDIQKQADETLPF